jgi:autotransporter-associated beta strand protein
MNSDHSHPPADSGPPHDPVSADEARVLAVLLGEASPFETEAVAELLAARPDLRAYRDRTAALLGLVVDAANPEPVETELRLDESRRAALLEKLREPAVESSVSDTTIQFPSGGSAQRGRLIGFFRVAVVASRRYAALLAVLLLLGVGLSTTVGIRSSAPRRAESEPAAKSADSFAVGGAGATGYEGEGRVTAHARRESLIGNESDSAGATLQSATGNRTLDSAFKRQNAPSRVSSMSGFSSAAADLAPREAEPKPESPSVSEPVVAAEESAAAPAPVATPAAAPSAPAGRFSLDLQKEGKGELTLNGANAYTGGTKVSAGTLTLSGDTTVTGTAARDRDAGEIGAAVGSAMPFGGASAGYADTRSGRIVSKSAEASGGVPKSESEASEKQSNAFAGGLDAGGMSKGEAGGSGGGEGAGQGMGIGRGVSRNYSVFKSDKDADAPGDRRDVADKVPVFGDLPLSGKLFANNESKKANVAEQSRQSNGKDDSGRLSKAKLLDEVDMKWALSDEVTKSLEGAKGKVIANDGAELKKNEALGIESMEFSTTTFSPTTFARMVGPSAGAAADESITDSDRILRYFRSVGIEFDKTKGTGLGYSDGRLVVTQTPRNLRRIQSILQRYSDAKKEVPKPSPAVIAQTETQAADNAFSTFSLNVSDVSFRLAAEATKRGAYPDTGGIRSEEFVNAQRYRDPAPRAEEPVALTQEQARHPFAHNRNLVRLSLKTNTEGRSAQQPLSLVVLLDNSGSMERSDRRETAAAAVNTLAANVRPGDKISVIGFARNTRLLVDRMDGSNTKPLRDLANNPPPTEGGTNMEGAIRAAYSQLARQTPAGVPGRVVLLTDGAANLGDADPARLATMVESNRLKGQALDAYGVGFDGYDDGMLERLSRKGDGRYAFLNNAADAGAELGQKLAGALRPFANDVKVQVEFNPARVSSWRLLGYDNHRLRKQDFRDNTVDAAELAAAEAGTALYAFEPKADGVGDVGVVRVRYRVPGTQDYREREWPIPYEAPPAFNDAPEGVRLAGCAAFVAEAFANNPNSAATDRAELRKQVSRLASTRPGDKPLSDLRILADKLATP